MPVGIQQPSGQIKFTNVSLVRLKKGKKRFEIACYKNKVLEWRSGQETDLDNVLQIPSVFTNVGKGQLAPKDDLHKAFGADTRQEDIVLEILRRGELQVGEKERQEQLGRVQREVLDMVAGRLVDPRSKRVYTPGMIEKALEQIASRSAQAQQQIQGGAKQKDGEEGKAPVVEENPDKDLPSWSGVSPTKSAKIQALDAMKALIAWQVIPVARARMRARITCQMGVLKQATKGPAPSKEQTSAIGDAEKSKASGGTVKDRILSYIEETESQGEVGGEWEVIGFVEPGAFHGLSEFIGSETRGKGRVEVLDMAVVNDGD